MDQLIQTVLELQKNALSLQWQISALRTERQILLELMLSQSPSMKAVVVEGLTQILARPEQLQESGVKPRLLDDLARLLKDLQAPSRTTPEGRRSWLHLVAPPEVPRSTD